MELIRAIVTDTDDPEGAGRVEVSSPEMGDFWPVWASVVQAFGASDPSSNPKISDVVVIGFVGGDPTQPIVLGRLP